MTSLAAPRPAVKSTSAQRIAHGGVRILDKLSDGSLLVVIRSETKKGPVQGTYNVTRIGSDWGDGFALVQIPEKGAGTAEMETRHVHLANDGHTCTCPDHVYRGSCCKHLAATTALVRAGRI